ILCEDFGILADHPSERDAVSRIGRQPVRGWLELAVHLVPGRIRVTLRHVATIRRHEPSSLGRTRWHVLFCEIVPALTSQAHLMHVIAFLRDAAQPQARTVRKRIGAY